MRQDYKVIQQKIPLPFKVKKGILSLGAQTKNSICFAQGNFAYLSRLHQDLSYPPDFNNFERDVKFFLKKNPRVIAYDLHPEYQSTKFALELEAKGRRLRAIQHHHAHIASCMAENKLKNQKVIGVAFDGTGLGDDGKIWGAEFLITDYKNFKRKAHLKEIPLLGGERAILEPWRLLLAWGILPENINARTQKILKKMQIKGINAPLASSMGRLFDAAASLILKRNEANFEAQLAIELEKLASRVKEHKEASYNFKITKLDNYIIDPHPMFKEIIADLKAGKPKEEIAYRLHLTVAQMIARICLILKRENKINKVVFSGGCFQNKLLTRLALGLLEREGFQVFTHKKLSSTDQNISLGQCLIAGS